MVTTTPPPSDTPDTENNHAIIPAGTNAAVDAMREVRFRIPGDKVAVALRAIENDEDRALVSWFAGYLRALNVGPEGAERILRKDGKKDSHYSWASIYALLIGKRGEDGASIAPMLRAIKALRRSVEGESRLGSAGFVQTRLSQAIFDRLDKARRRRRIAFIIGDSQIGKSEAEREYTRTHNHGETFYLDTPSSGAHGALIQAFSERLNIGQVSRSGDLEMRIAECFDEKKLVILDNAQRMLRSRCGLRAMTFLQWLYDARGCGMAFFMTYEGHGNLINGGSKKHLEQLWRRRIPPLMLPSRTPDDDLALFAAKFGLEPAPEDEVAISVEYVNEQGRRKEKEYRRVPYELQTEVVTKEGLGVWLETLEEAKAQAAAHRRPLSWKAVLKAHCAMQADGEVLL